jgi:hypothetical protein
LIILALWVAPALVLAVILLWTVGRDRVSHRAGNRKPKSPTRSH